MKKLRFSKLLPLALLAVSGSMVASATKLGTGTADGTYTYVFNLPNGASFTMTTVGGPIGGPHSSTSTYSYSGTPDNLYATEGSVTGTGNDTYTVSGDPTSVDGGFDVEILLQYNLDGSYANRLDYYFTEPNSFWEQVGTDQSFTTGADEYISGVVGLTAVPEANVNFLAYGEVAEGATYAYTNTPDPACTSCTVTTTFVPAVPEPSSLALLSTGMAAAIGAYRKRRGSL